jgi:hypothetical protein
MSRERSTKRGVEAAKRDKAARKQERKVQRAEGGEDVDVDAASDPGSVMESLRLLHERFEDGNMAFEEFEQAKQELLARLG